jgi:DNA-binding transcriptional LysR family regulator
MDRADFELVVAIADTGSLSGAARVLHIAQPPLSRRLQHLEREVGAPLFVRGRHGATATVVGRALIDSARAALDAIARAEQDAADTAAGRAGRLRIGVTPTLGAGLLPEVLAAFRRSHRNVRLDLTASGDSAGLRAQVASGDLDIAVAALATRVEAGTQVALSGEQKFVLIAPADLRLAKTVPHHRLVGLPVVALTAGEGLRQNLDQIYAGIDAEPDIAIETSERDMLVPFVAAGIGVALVPDDFARARPARGFTIHELNPAVRRSIGAIVADGDVPTLVSEFLDALAAGTDLVRARAAPRRRTPRQAP